MKAYDLNARRQGDVSPFFFLPVTKTGRILNLIVIPLVCGVCWHSIKPEEIVSITNKQELRKPLSKISIMENYEITTEAMKSGAESVFYKEKLSEDIIKDTVQKLITYL